MALLITAPTQKMGLPSAERVSFSKDIPIVTEIAVAESLVLRLNICGKKHAYCKSV
jgi:hypothetical protein